MSQWSPPRLPRPLLVAGIVAWALWLLYTLIIVQQVLLGLLPGFLFVGVYVAWRFLAALEAIADAQQRLAAERERENRE